MLICIGDGIRDSLINDYAPLYLDEQPCNKEDCYKMFYVLSKIFNVSKEVIKYRLKNEKLLLTPE